MFRVITEGRAFREHALLKDGTPVLLRAAGPGDAGLLSDLYARASDESLRLRFGSAAHRPDPDQVDPVPADGLRLLALTGEGERRRAVGVGEFLVLRDGRSAEVSFLVDDASQGRGVSTLLLERLAGLAAARGVVAFRAEVLAENTPMLRVFRDSGFTVHLDRAGDTVLLEFPLDDAPALRERSDLREHVAAARSLRPLLRPRSVAVVGVTADPDAPGTRLLRHIREGGYTGRLAAVGPVAEPASGVVSCASLAELPEPPELVVAAVPAERVLAVAERAAAVGARALLVPGSGYAETGPAGERRERRLAEIAAAGGMRLLGPASLGVVCNHPDVRLNASPAPALPPRGGIGFFSHSGALGLAVMEHAAARGLGFSSFVAGGHRADVSGADLLHWWCDDPDTRLVLLYLERFRSPRRFFRAARRIARRLPVLCVKSARSLAGRRTAGPGAAGTFGDERTVEALFHQAGLLRADTLDEMFDLALLLETQPLPAGPRVTVVANSRGVATLVADACAAWDLRLSGPGLVELPAAAPPDAYADAVARALADPGVDALIVGHACVGEACSEPVARAVDAAVAAAAGRPRPVLLNLVGRAGVVPGDGGRAYPSYLFPESAPRALGRALRHARRRARPAGSVPWPAGVDGPELRRRALALLAGRDGTLSLSGDPAADLLAPAGIAAVGGEPAGTDAAITLRNDPYFGPILHASRGGTTVVRLVPLTDIEIDEALAHLAPPGEPGHAALADLLARLSRLVEELPWLRELQAGVRIAGGAGAAALADPRLVLEPHPGPAAAP